MPLEEFVQSSSMLAALRKGVTEMKKRKPSDPLSWFYQAAIHGVTEAAVKKATADDPNVANVPADRWNQCPHKGENSANFLPWHRGYTYHFEKILRMHTGDDSFSLPYWDYVKKTNRKFPKEFGIQHLDGNLNNEAPENINPLFIPERDFYFASYEHPFATGLPLLELSDDAVDISLPMNSPVFFGDTETEGIGGGIADSDPTTRGLFEGYPHDQIHRSVGGIVLSPEGTTSVGAMANPPTAGFDPIFPVHHANIDRLWMEWSCMPGKSWGKLPPNSWLNESPWIFIDTDGREVKEPRKKYFDHRALGVKFKYEDPNCTPLQLPATILSDTSAVAKVAAQNKAHKILAVNQIPFSATSIQRAIILVREQVKQPLRNPSKTFRDRLRNSNVSLADTKFETRIILRLKNVDLSSLHAAGFDLHLTSNPRNPSLKRTDPSFVGSIKLFNHPMMHAGRVPNTADDGRTQSFDVTRSVAAVPSESLEGLSLVLVPYSLLTSSTGETVMLGNNVIKVGSYEFVLQ
jgi:hypothetical protein